MRLHYSVQKILFEFGGKWDKAFNRIIVVHRYSTMIKNHDVGFQTEFEAVRCAAVGNFLLSRCFFLSTNYL